MDITDVRNCWSKSTLDYDSDKLIKIDLTPLDCTITSNIILKLSYLENSIWNPVKLVELQNFNFLIDTHFEIVTDNIDQKLELLKFLKTIQNNISTPILIVVEENDGSSFN